MPAQIAYYPKFKVFLPNSTQVASGGFVYTYIAGTSTFKTTYSDQALTTANANPIVLDSAGEADIWLDDDTLYKFVIYDADMNLISQRDNVGEIASSTPITGNYNLVKNGSFETDSNGDLTPDDWTLSITSGGNIAISTVSQNHGQNSLLFTGGGSGAGTATSDYFEVQAGKEVSIRFSLKASAATVLQTVTVYWYKEDKSAASTASTAIYNVTTTAPTTWTEQILSATAGSDATFAKIQINGSASAGTTYYDDVFVQDLIPGTAVQDATETNVGVIELATQAEVDAGTDAVRAVTPATLVTHLTNYNYPGSWELLSTTAASASATIEIPLPADPTTYKIYKILLHSVAPDTDTVSFTAQFAYTSAGSPVWLVAAYEYHVQHMYPASTTYTASAATAATSILLAAAAGTAAAEFLSGELTIYYPYGSPNDYTRLYYDIGQKTATSTHATNRGAGVYNGTSVMTHIRFLMSSGNIASGDFILYGLK